MDTPLAQTYSNQKVFKAAVNALGSNSRNWASFVKVRDQDLEGLLYDFDPEKSTPPSSTGRWPSPISASI